jgi:hypothetical protein
MTNNKCPHCNKTFIIHEKAFIHADCYANPAEQYKLNCTKCHKPIKVILQRRVTVSSVSISDHPENESDYPNSDSSPF